MGVLGTVASKAASTIGFGWAWGVKLALTSWLVSLGYRQYKDNFEWTPRSWAEITLISYGVVYIDYRM